MGTRPARKSAIMSFTSLGVRSSCESKNYFFKKIKRKRKRIETKVILKNIYIKFVVDLDHGGVGAGAQALDLCQREQLV